MAKIVGYKDKTLNRWLKKKYRKKISKLSYMQAYQIIQDLEELCQELFFDEEMLSKQEELRILEQKRLIKERRLAYEKRKKALKILF